MLFKCAGSNQDTIVICQFNAYVCVLTCSHCYVNMSCLLMFNRCNSAHRMLPFPGSEGRSANFKSIEVVVCELGGRGGLETMTLIKVEGGLFKVWSFMSQLTVFFFFFFF